MVRRISFSSRPITGSSLPLRAISVRSRAYFLQGVIGILGRGAVGGTALAQIGDRGVEALGGDAGLLQDTAGFGAAGQHQRQQQIFGGDETVAGLLGGLFGAVPERVRPPGTDRPDRKPPCTFGNFLSAASTQVRTCVSRPPAALISRAARPSSSSIRTFRRCSGTNCWLPSRTASDWADWMKPRARSVNFSISMLSPGRPLGHMDKVFHLSMRRSAADHYTAPAGRRS